MKDLRGSDWCQCDAELFHDGRLQLSLEAQKQHFKESNLLAMEIEIPDSSTEASAENSSPPSPSETHECDYDKNPTDLYQAIERREWKYALDLFQSDKVGDEASTWVVRKEVSGKLRWRLLPLHAAIIFKGPLKLVELLLADNPMAAQSKDDQGMLPLHLAFRNESSWEIVEELMTAYPQAIFETDRKGRTPLQCGEKKGSSSASVSSIRPENRSFKNIISVLDLYAQITASGVRQKAQEESTSMADATVAQLKASHEESLKEIEKESVAEKQESQFELAKLREENRALKDMVQSQELDLSVAQSTEKQLTEKLREMTIALKNSNKIIQVQQEDLKKEHTNIMFRNVLESMIKQQKEYEYHLQSIISKYSTLIAEREKIQAIFIKGSDQQTAKEAQILEDAKKFLVDQQKKFDREILGSMGEEKKTEEQ